MRAWIATLIAGSCFGLAPLHGVVGPPLWLLGLVALALSVRAHVGGDLLRGAVVGVLWYGISLRWVALEWVDLDGNLSLPWISWLGVTLLQATVPAAGLGLAGAVRARGWPLPVALAVGLAAAEGLAPWIQPLPGGIALYLAPVQPLLWPAAWLGLPGLLLVVGLWAGLQVQRPLVGAGVLAAWTLLGLLPAPTSGQTLRVGLVQPNIGAFEARRPSTRDSRRERVVQAVRAASRAGADVIVTPEGVWPDLLDPRRPSTERALARAFGSSPDQAVPVVLGAMVGDVRPPTNSLLLVQGSAIDARQDKVHLVPISERQVLGLGRDLFTAGTGRVPLPVAGTLAVGLVCYEDVVPSAARGWGPIGWAIASTNDAWLGAGPGSRQHEAGTRLLAVRTGRWVVRPAMNGRSAVFDPSGRRAWHAPYVDGDAADAQALVTVVPIRARTPTYAAADVEPWLGLGAALLALLGVLRDRPGYSRNSPALRPDVSIDGSKG